jgi:hypothetical protein
MSTVVADRSDVEPDATPPRRSALWRWLIIIACALIALMWAYAFLWAPSKGVYRVDDAHWRSEAQTICKAATAQRLKLADTGDGFIAHPTHEQMIQHADLVDGATDILEKMLDDVVAVPVPTARDRELIATFEKYYRIIIADRRDYTAKLRRFELANYQETSVDGGPVTNVVTDFTSGNNIKACVPPGELGATI